jgi:hypothetical protein
VTGSRSCANCGRTLESHHGRRGRPRKWCSTCLPAGDPAEYARRWRELNSAYVDTYNALRRVEPGHGQAAARFDRPRSERHMALSDYLIDSDTRS